RRHTRSKRDWSSDVCSSDLKALLFDSWFDVYRGVLVLVRLIDGEVRRGMKIRLMSNGQVYPIESVGVLNPKMKEVDRLLAGEVRSEERRVGKEWRSRWWGCH